MANIAIEWAMTLNGETDPVGYRVNAALIEGAINEIPVAYMEFLARDKNLDLGNLVGTEMGFRVEDENQKSQSFWGTCISAETKGSTGKEGIYIAEIRPWLWFLTRSRNNRIYQEMTTTQIVSEILGDYGFSSNLKLKHTVSETAREYCVQYRETDLNFVKRLLHDEGIYFYFEHEEGAVNLILADQPSTHPQPGKYDQYLFSDKNTGGARERISSWQLVERAVTGKVTLRDYDFTKPSSDLTVAAALPSGKHSHDSYEEYTYPGKYRDVSDGDASAAARVEGHASEHQIWTATGTMLNLNVGKIIDILDHPNHQTTASNGFMVTRMTQFLSGPLGSVPGGTFLTVDPSLMDVHQDAKAADPKTLAAQDLDYHFSTSFHAVQKSKPYRGHSTAPRPNMTGVQTAVVTGPKGEEISVDEYGRIKVQFHWDRQGRNDENTSCWVRTMMPWTGKNWGMISLPRIGQEVVIQFEEGDPDRPLCVGMLYNADTMPPYPLPGNATRTGIKTNSSKDGGGYNELMLEDKKGDELVRFMAEKDYVQNVQNQAHIKVGYKHETDVKSAKAQADKSMKLEVENHLDEIVEKGDHSFEVETGKQTIKIKGNKTETNSAKSTLTVVGNKTTTVTEGNVKETVDVGNKETTVKAGNISVNASIGKIDMEAKQSITLKVGPSEIKIDMQGVSIKGPMIKIEGTAMVEAKSPLTTVKGDALLTLKGGLTLIN